MSDKIQVAAAPELAAIEVETIDRSSFLIKGALAVGAVYGATAVTPFIRNAFAQGASKGDIDILNFALTLEYLEAAFYEGGADVSGLSDEVAGYVETFGKEEQEHVDALSATISDLGGKPVKAPGVDFGDAFSSADAFVQTAITFEDLGVGAYDGAAPMIEDKELLATAGAIVQVEARHAAAVRFAAGEDPAPEAFDPALSEKKVLEAVTPFLTG